jgi:hypothetical protein
MTRQVDAMMQRTRMRNEHFPPTEWNTCSVLFIVHFEYVCWSVSELKLQSQNGQLHCPSEADVDNLIILAMRQTAMDKLGKNWV